MVNEEVLKTVETCAANHAAHVVDIAVRGSRAKTIVDIFVDAEPGVTTDLCSDISREVADAFEKKDLIKGAYELVVSSPGIERPLRFSWQYKKHIGRKFVMKVRNAEAVQ